MKNFFKILFKKRFLIGTMLVLALVCLSACKMNIDQGGSASYTERNSSCWTCQFFGVVYRGLANFSENSVELMSEAGLSLLVSGLALWLAFYLGQNLIITTEEPSYKEVWSTVFITLGKSFIAGLLLSSKDIFYRVIQMIYVPIVELWMFFAMEVLKVDTGTGGLLENLKTVALTTDYTDKAGVFPEIIGKQIETILYRIQVAFDIGQTIGMRLLVEEDITTILLGLLVICCFFYLSVIFPLYFIDAVLRFGLALIFMPLVLVAWALPISLTKGMVKTFFKSIMGTGAQFTIAAAFIAFVLALMDNFLQQQMGFTAAEQETNPELSQNLVRMKPSGLLLFVLCFYLIKLAGRVSSIASKMTDTAGGRSLLSGWIATFKKLAVQGAALIAGFFTAGAGTAISMADAAIDKTAEKVSGESGKEGGGS